MSITIKFKYLLHAVDTVYYLKNSREDRETEYKTWTEFFSTGGHIAISDSALWYHAFENHKMADHIKIEKLLILSFFSNAFKLLRDYQKAHPTI